MKQSSPTLEGFRAVFRQPTLALAEIAWRWSVGWAAVSLLMFSTYEYLRTLPVTNRDLLFLRTGQPLLIQKAIRGIFSGSGARVVWTTLVLSASLAIGWTVVAALGRAAIVKALLSYFRKSEATAAAGALRSLIGLNLFRVVATLAALIACFGAVVVAGSVSSKSDPSPGSVMLIFLMLAMFIWLSWSLLNWLLSLASIFVVSEGRDALGAVEGAVGLCQREMGSLFAAGTWFGLAHVAAFVIATSVVAFPLGFARILPGGVVIGGVLLVTLLYFATADFLYAGRLAAYVAILELPDVPSSPLMIAPSLPSPVRLDSPASVDPDELILSDVPVRPSETGL